jgi:hypothetical protein
MKPPQTQSQTDGGLDERELVGDFILAIGACPSRLGIQEISFASSARRRRRSGSMGLGERVVIGLGVVVNCRPDDCFGG